MKHLLWACILAFALTATCQAAAPVTQPSGERADLVAPRQRWTQYPSDVSSVCFDRGRRAWFMVAQQATVDQIKHQVERSMTLSAPWVAKAKIVLFDSTGRIWLLAGPQMLLGYDPKTGAWIERLSIDYTAPGDSTTNKDHQFTGAVVEDSARRVFAADAIGCHMYDHGAWTYRPMNDVLAPGTPVLPIQSDHGPIAITTDDQGRAYVWNLGEKPGGFLGCEMHDQKGWRRILRAAGQNPGRFLAIIPLHEGRILVCPTSGPAFILPISSGGPDEAKRIADEIDKLADDAFAKREKAQRWLIAQGEAATPQVKTAMEKSPAPEIRLPGARILKAIEAAKTKPAVDGHELLVQAAIFRAGVADAFLWSRPTSVLPGRLDVWRLDADGRLHAATSLEGHGPPPAGLAVDSTGHFLIAGQSLQSVKDGKQVSLTEEDDGRITHLFGLDKQGRIYVRIKNNVICIDPSAPETRPLLTVTYYDTMMRSALMTADGKMCAHLAGQGHGFLSLFDKDRWIELPAPEHVQAGLGFTFIQPLRDGGLVAQQTLDGQAFLYEGGHWSVFPDLRHLVQEKADLLSKQVDNALPGADDMARIRVDARGALWLRKMDGISVWYKDRWLPEPRSQHGPMIDCLPVFGGRLMLLSDRGPSAYLARIESGAITFNPYRSAGVFSIRYLRPRLLEIDAMGRSFLSQMDGTVTIFNAADFRVIPKVGVPRLEDSAHRIWFVDQRRRKLTVLDGAGVRAEFDDKAIGYQSTVVEDKDHTYWMNTSEGLRHLSASHDDQAIRPIGPVYSRGIPTANITGMWLDPQRNLWLFTYTRLYRVRLP